jgi:hypothetical protein
VHAAFGGHATNYGHLLEGELWGGRAGCNGLQRLIEAAQLDQDCDLAVHCILVAGRNLQDCATSGHT